VSVSREGIFGYPLNSFQSTSLLMKLPRETGPIHFVGIGGIGMSGIAEVLANLGYTVQGSDAADNYNVKRLKEKGIRTFIGHAAENLGEAEVLVVSTAIRRDNAELLAAREKRLPVVRRAEMLAELMRLKTCVAVAGTHGKTTTTSLVATLLDQAGFDPTVINGGIINAYGTNARLGAGDWMVVEADESDGTFLKLPTDIAIVTNIDPEHLDHFKTFEAIKEAFRSFVENIPFYGFAVMCLDHPVVQDLVGTIEDRRVVTYGENPQADIRLVELELAGGQSRFKLLVRDRKSGAKAEIADLGLPMPGAHNALNATAAVAVAHTLGISPETIRKALESFGGVKRRFTRTGDWNGVSVFDDYGHHPVEIAAVLKAARASTAGQVIAVVQPHRYSRLASLFNDFSACFNDADVVIVADVYPAGEAPIEGIDRDGLVAGIKARGHRHVLALDRPGALAGLIASLAGPSDYVVCLGAGSITQWAYALPHELAALG
jgi:UDP-N-acetylmuramate--alanine ligase